MSVQGRAQPLGWIDATLVVVFLLGLYLNVSLQITPRIPLTCAPSGIAGLALLWRRRDRLEPAHLGWLLAIIALYLASILSAENYAFLGKRFTGLLQLTYSLVIAYAFFITLVHAERRQIATILLTFCILVVIGAFLEQYTELRVISDKVRERLYDSSQVYEADLRDQLLYGRIRPKLFTSEPSNVTFSYTHFAFLWLVISPWRWKLAVYAVLMGLGFAATPGPTLLLLLMLAVPYLIFLGGHAHDRSKRNSAIRLIGGVVLSGILVVGAVIIGSSLYAERLRDFTSGNDPSTFFRVIGPMLIAFDVFKHRPWAGIGLTAEAFIENDAFTIYMNASGGVSTGWYFKIAEAITNYFWLHWIYLGLVWGTIMIVALTIWLRMLRTPSILFCWAVWVILGQAAGAYVGPRAWTVLFCAAAGAVLASRPEPARMAAGSAVSVRRYPVLASMMAARRERLG